MSDSTQLAEFIGRQDDHPGVTVNGKPIEQHAGLGGGGYEGADRIGRELLTFRPRVSTADGALGVGDKILLDARGIDLTRNSGQIQGVRETHKDSIVGAQYRLNAKPNLVILGTQSKAMDDVWADEFQQEVEAIFSLYAESDMHWIDAQRQNSFTDIIRLMIAVYFTGGEVLGQMKYLNDRPFKTCFHMLDADRLSNPNDAADTLLMRRGVERDRNGALLAAHIRSAHPRDYTAGAQIFKWDRIKFWTPFGRTNVLHILEQNRAEQTRGIAQMVAAIKETRMGKKFNEVSLQNAIIQATYAAAIESELPKDMAFEMIGAGDAGQSSYTAEAMAYLGAIAEYTRGGKNIEIGGVKIPHLFPGSRLNMMPAGTVGGVGQTFEESLNRHISASVGVSYEELTNDFTKTNYSSFRGATNKTLKHMRSQKRAVSDRGANVIYGSFLEELIVNNKISSMPRNAPNFYDGINREAYCAATWIGASAGQVDEMKETQAAILRINNNLSTIEIESARLGYDFREVFKQKSREKVLMTKLGIEPQPELATATKPGTMSSQRGAKKTTDKEAAYIAGDIDQDGVDENGNKPFDDGFGD